MIAMHLFSYFVQYNISNDKDIEKKLHKEYPDILKTKKLGDNPNDVEGLTIEELSPEE